MALRDYFNQIGQNLSNNDAFKDLGFGNKSFDLDQRLINRDGSINVKKKGRPYLRPYDAYNALISMSWLKFLFLVCSTYFLANLLFAFIYVLIGIDELSVNKAPTFVENMAEAFFFSSQTITTVGYGRVNPVGFWAGVVSSVESLLGLMGFALITGLIYGRFSRPHARILYSDHAIIAPYQNINAFMFRIANKRSSELVEVHIKLVYTYYNHQEQRRVFENLNLERSKVDFLALSWTIVHPIDEDSPFCQLSKEELEQQNGEFLVMIKAFDDSFSQEVHARSSYKHDEIIWGRRFTMSYGGYKNGMVALWMDSIHDSEEAPLN